MSGCVEVIVNGEQMAVPYGATVGDVLRWRGLGGRRLAVERNGEIVSRSRFDEVTVAAHDRLEIVIAVGGG